MRDILVASENWASAAHHGLLHDGHPTLVHLGEVVAKLHEVEIAGCAPPSEDTVAAAWLHDTLRYTNTAAWEIGKTLNRRVQEIVELMTDPGPRPVRHTGYDAARANSKALAYTRFKFVEDQSLRREAGLLRCVDRFCNQRSALAGYRTDKVRTYAAEFADHMRVYGITLLDPKVPHRVTLWNELMGQYAEMAVVLSNATD